MKILVAEDDPVSRRLLQVSLTKWGYQVTATGDGEEAWRMLQNPDTARLVILDWMMPSLDGVGLCRRIRQSGNEPYTYLILLTAKRESEDIVRGLEAGADDYIVKPFHVQELRVRVRAGERLVRLQEELISAREALRKEATHDSLTRLWNRGAILAILEHDLNLAQREQASLGLAMGDLDYLKTINDNYGHQAGDAVLQEAARRMQSALRGSDAVGRYGGDEFLIIMPAADSDAVVRIAERVRAAVSDIPVRLPQASFHLTLSIGVTSTQKLLGIGAKSFVRAADQALYQAKKAGRNRVEFLSVAKVEEKKFLEAVV